MSLFGTLIRQAAKVSDNLLDDIAVQAKHVEEVFDEEAWIAANPRPDGPANSPAVRQWYGRKDYAKNRGKRLASKKADYEKDLEKSRKRLRDQYGKDIEKTRERDRRYRDKNREKRKEYARGWRERNAGLHASRVKEAKAARQKRLPAWRNQESINEIYKTAAEISAETGIPHHVDHVMPLQGRTVSGLHHQDNLLIVPGDENLSKGNRFEPGDLPPRAGIRNARAYLKKIRAAKEKARRK